MALLPRPRLIGLQSAKAGVVAGAGVQLVEHRQHAQVGGAHGLVEARRGFVDGVLARLRRQVRHALGAAGQGGDEFVLCRRGPQKGAYLVARALDHETRRQQAARGGGAILNNASICATQPLWYEPIYNVTKAALVMLSKNVANELIPMGIRAVITA